MSNIDQVGNCWFLRFLRLMDVCIMHRKKRPPFFVPSYTPLPTTIYFASHFACFPFEFSILFLFFVLMDDLI
jgi:hypothetical protein